MGVLRCESLGHPADHGLGIGQGGAVEDVANGLAHLPGLGPVVDMSLSVLSQVKLTVLPRNRRKHGPASGSQSHVIITED